MGKILNIKYTSKGKVRCELELDYDEAVQLRGSLKQVYAFSDEIKNNDLAKTHISVRGPNGSSKYFLLPKALRHGIKFPKEMVCIRHNVPGKVFFIYSIKTT